MDLVAKGLAGNKIRTIVCVGCGETVARRARPGTKYCSLACYRSGSRPARRTGVTRECEQCGATFYVPKSRVVEARFCGTACANDWQGRNKTEHVCTTCGERFRWSPSRSAGGQYNIKYCSITCRDQDPEYRAAVIASHARLLRGRVTGAEAAGYALLDSLSVQYDRQAVFNGKFTPDALVSEAMLVIQFDGDYWHDRKGTSTEARIRRRVALDRSQDAYIRACGWRVLRLWESDLLNDLAGCAEKVRQHLRPPS